MKVQAKSLRIAPKKLRLIANLVCNKDVSEAMEMLKFLPKKGAKLLYKVVHSAVANAETNFKQDAKTLYIKEINVNKAPTLKRSRPVSRGRSHPILKRNSNVILTVAVRENAAPKKKAAAAKPTDTKPVSKKKSSPSPKSQQAS